MRDSLLVSLPPETLNTVLSARMNIMLTFFKIFLLAKVRDKLRIDRMECQHGIINAMRVRLNKIL